MYQILAGTAAADQDCLQLSNVDTLSAYILGSGSEKKLPVQRAFRNEVVGSSAEDLKQLLQDFAQWLRGNCTRQLQAYRWAES